MTTEATYNVEYLDGPALWTGYGEKKVGKLGIDLQTISNGYARLVIPQSNVFHHYALHKKSEDTLFAHWMGVSQTGSYKDVMSMRTIMPEIIQ